MFILAIETSCDETAVAVVKFQGSGHRILANIVSSQVKIHAKYGGVVPNLASRMHLKNIIPCIIEADRFASRGYQRGRTRKSVRVDPRSYPRLSASTNIDLIAVTIGPGLIPALLIGTNTAKALAYAWDKPIIGVNHIEAHIYANFVGIRRNNADKNAEITLKGSASNRRIDQRRFSGIFPALCLVVSGGHTQLILTKGHGKYKLLGETRDDAVGEAFDKVAKLLNLGYPGGPAIAAKAAKFKIENLKFKIDLPRPMIHSKDFDFSFSGLKTAVLYLVKDGVATFTSRSDRSLKAATPSICASFQQAVIDVLIAKTIRAAKEVKAKTVMLAGGVAANKELRRQFKKAIKEELPNTCYLIPDTQYCTDNAVMVAVAAYYRLLHNKPQTWKDIEANANLRIA